RYFDASFNGYKNLWDNAADDMAIRLAELGEMYIIPESLPGAFHRAPALVLLQKMEAVNEFLATVCGRKLFKQQFDAVVTPFVKVTNKPNPGWAARTSSEEFIVTKELIEPVVTSGAQAQLNQAKAPD